MMAGIALQIAGAAMLVLLGATALGLIVAALVVWLAPLTGTAGALGLAGLGLAALALATMLGLRQRARAARRQLGSMQAVVGLAELALRLLPRDRLHRIEAGSAAIAGLAALIFLLFDAPPDRASTSRPPDGPADDA